MNIVVYFFETRVRSCMSCMFARSSRAASRRRRFFSEDNGEDDAEEEEEEDEEDDEDDEEDEVDDEVVAARCRTARRFRFALTKPVAVSCSPRRRKIGTKFALW